MRGSVSAKPSRRRRCSGGPSVISEQLRVGPAQRHQILVVDEVRKMKRHPARDAGARGGHEAVNRRPALEQVDVRRPRRGSPSRARSARPARSRTSARRRRARPARGTNRPPACGRCRAAPPDRRPGSLSSGYFLLARRTTKCFIRKIAASRAAASICAWRCRLDAEQPRDERAQRPRHLDQQRRLLGRRQRRAVAVRREARRQRRVARGQLGAEALRPAPPAARARRDRRTGSRRYRARSLAPRRAARFRRRSRRQICRRQRLSS